MEAIGGTVAAEPLGMNTEVIMVAVEAATIVGSEEEDVEEEEIADMGVAELVCVMHIKKVTAHEEIHVDSPMKIAAAAVVVVYATPGKRVIVLEEIRVGFPTERIQVEIAVVEIAVMVAAVVYAMPIRRATVFEEILVDFLMTMEVEVSEAEIEKAVEMIDGDLRSKAGVTIEGVTVMVVTRVLKTASGITEYFTREIQVTMKTHPVPRPVSAQNLVIVRDLALTPKTGGRRFRKVSVVHAHLKKTLITSDPKVQLPQ